MSINYVVRLTPKAFDLYKYRLELVEKEEKKDSHTTPKQVIEAVRCPFCGSNAVKLNTLNRYYCFTCKRYV